MRVLVSLLFILSSDALAQSQLDPDSKNLAACISVFAYGANWFLVQDNEGAAKMMIMQQSRTTALLFSIYYEDEKVPGEKLAAFKKEGRGVKPYLDNNPDEILETIDSCTLQVNEISLRTPTKGKLMWGKNVSELSTDLALTLRQALGIN